MNNLIISLFVSLLVGLGLVLLLRIKKHFEFKGIVSKVAQYKPHKGKYWTLVQNRQKKFLFLVNPFGGKGFAKRVLEEVVVPMFTKAEIPFQSIETKYSGHAKELMKTLPLEEYCGIGVISGDGLVSEVTNGLASRIQSSDSSKVFELLHKFPIAIIPAGSSNGMSSSFGAKDIFTAVKNTIEGAVRSVDINEITLKDNTKIWDCMHVSWGSVGDHDTLQENKFRWMDTNIRNLLAPLCTIIVKPIYKGKLYFMPVQMTEEERTKCHYADLSKFKRCEEKGDNWYILEEDFFFIAGMNLSEASDDVKAAPGAYHCEGAVDLLVIKNASSFELLKMFLAMGSGSHVQQKCVHYMKVQQFIIEPITMRGYFSAKSQISISGELIPAMTFHVKSHKGGAAFIF